jgi:arsenate reductase
MAVSALADLRFDHVITVCDHARESCPVFPSGTGRLHWSFEDPAKAIGTVEERRAFFRRVRDEILDRVRAFIAGEET